MPRSIRFIHSADLHLGSPLKTLGKMSGSLQRTFREASYKAVERLVDSVLSLNADFLLLSGDLYDRDARSVKANEFLAGQMERLNERNIPVYIIYGNHDPLGAAADLYQMPANVKVFSCEEAQYFDVRRNNSIPVARVYGQSYRNTSDTRKMYANFQAADNDILNIGMLHTALSPGARAYVPCSLEDLRKVSNIHYWALGHVHGPSVVSSANPAAAYPGIPQGRDIGEPGVGGCLLVEANTGETPKIRFIPLAEIVWLKIEIPISRDEPEDMNTLEEMILDKAQAILAANASAFYPPISPLSDEPHKIAGYIVRWEITGRGKLHEAIAGQDITELSATVEARLRQAMGTGSPFLWTESVRFRTSFPIPDIDTLVEKDMIFRILLDRRQEIETRPELQKKAISALGNIWDRQKDAEDLREDCIPFTDDKLVELLDRAQSLVIDRIYEERKTNDN